MTKIMLSSERFGCYSITQVKKNGKSIFVQSDWDFPSTAGYFGWNMRSRNCRHDGTDGTIICPDCHKTVSEFIGESIQFLDNNDGKVVLDKFGLF